MHAPDRPRRSRKQHQVRFILPRQIGVFYGITHMPPQILFHVLIKSVIPFHLGNRHMQHIFQSLIEIKPHRIFMQRGIFSVHQFLHHIRVFHDIQKHPGEAVLRPLSRGALLSADHMIPLFRQNAYARNLLQNIQKQPEVLV